MIGNTAHQIRYFVCKGICKALGHKRVLHTIIILNGHSCGTQSSSTPVCPAGRLSLARKDCGIMQVLVENWDHHSLLSCARWEADLSCNEAVVTCMEFQLDCKMPHVAIVHDNIRLVTIIVCSPIHLNTYYFWTVLTSCVYVLNAQQQIQSTPFSCNIVGSSKSDSNL